MGNTKLEQLAMIYAIHRWRISPTLGLKLQDLEQSRQHEANDFAYAALVTMRKPTEGMLSSDDVERSNELHYWQRLIRAALEGK